MDTSKFKFKSLRIRLVVVVVLMMFLPVVVTMAVYQYNLERLEKDAVDKVFRERYSTYDQIFDHVEVAYNHYLGLDYISDGVKMNLLAYDAHLRIIRADGILLYDSIYPTEVRDQLNLHEELKLISEGADLLSSIGKYIRPINENNVVIAYAIITDNPKQIEDSLYEEMQAFYIEPYYYGLASIIISTLILLLLIYYEILRPVKMLKASTRRISQGQLDFEIDCQTGNELGELCVDFDVMKTSLMDSMHGRLEEKNLNRLYIQAIGDGIKELEVKIDESAGLENKDVIIEKMSSGLSELSKDLAQYGNGKYGNFRLNREMVSSYRLVASLRKTREENHQVKDNVYLLPPSESSMLYVDTKKIIKAINQLIMAMNMYGDRKLNIYLETGSDETDYTFLQLKVFWNKSPVLTEFSIEDFIHNIYAETLTEVRQKLVEAVLLNREIVQESSGHMEMLLGDEVSGFILCLPRYTPNIQ